MMLAIVKDLFFKAKINETALQLNKKIVFIKNKDELESLIKKLTDNTEEKAELIIIDLNFTEMEPFETIKKIQSHELFKNTKIIGYCSHVQTDILKMAKELGIEAMPKSLFSKRLHNLISEFK